MLAVGNNREMIPVSKVRRSLVASFLVLLSMVLVSSVANFKETVAAIQATQTSPSNGLVSGGDTITIAGTDLQRLTMPAWRSIGVAGGRHHCAIAADSYIYCWGYNTSGTVGGTTTNIPVRIGQGAMPSQNGAKAIGDGVYSNCAIASDDWVYCWGDNGNGALGNGPTTSNSSTPVKVSQGAIPANATIKKLAIGQDGGCVIASDDWAYCWGRNINGQVGNNNTSVQRTPQALNHDNIPAGAKIIDLSMGFAYGCAIIDNGSAYCWGSNGNGALGNGNTTSSNIPVAVSMPSSTTFKQITTGGTVGAGNAVTCATATNGDGYCWGYGGWGQVGNGTTTSANNTPQKVSQGARPNGVGFTSITTGSYNAGYTVVCGLGTDNKAYCWGTGDTGELGNGTTNGSSNVPASAVSMPNGVMVLQLATGSDHSCALGSDYNTYCWGYGESGRLGNGSTSNQSTPVKVSKATVMDTYAPYSVVFDQNGTPAACNIANPATDITATSVTCTNTAHAAGAVDVTINNGAASMTLANGFTYFPPITISGVSPNRGLVSGDTTITISGTGFGASAPNAGTTVQEFNTCGASQQIILPAGAYKLEAWGAQGGYRTTNPNNGGKGGYSAGDIVLTSTQVVQVNVGCSGNNGGWNGGGTRTGAPYPGGGGGTDIRIGGTALTNRIIVAGGGGSEGGDDNANGGYAGGLSGGQGRAYYGQPATGGTQTTGGDGCWSSGNCTNMASTYGTFGRGGDSGTPQIAGSLIQSGGAGGGGWFGGGGSAGDYSGYDDAPGGAGGSGYVFTATSDKTGYGASVPNGQYYLSNTALVAGNATFVSPSGSNETGHIGDGYVRITPQATGFFPVILDVSGTPAPCDVTAWSDTSITCTTSAHAASLVSITVNNSLTSQTLANAYTYVEISLSLASGGVVDINATPSAMGSYQDTLTVKTNNPSGYTLQISIPTNNTADQSMTSISNASTINPASVNTLANNEWGFSLTGAASSWMAVPLLSNAYVLKTTSTPTPVSGENTSLYYGAKVDFTLPIASYRTQVMVTVVAN